MDETEANVDRTYLPRLVAAGAWAATGSTVRTAGRWRDILAARSPEVLQLAVRSVTADDVHPAAQAELRDGVIGVLRELTTASWQETRSGLADFELRSGNLIAARRVRPARPHRVKQ